MILFRYLGSILDIVRDAASTNGASLVAKRSGSSLQIARCKIMLDEAFQMFQVSGFFFPSFFV